MAAVGPDAGLLTAVVPEFAALLGAPPDAGDPLTAQAAAAAGGRGGVAGGRLAETAGRGVPR